MPSARKCTFNEAEVEVGAEVGPEGKVEAVEEAVEKVAKVAKVGVERRYGEPLVAAPTEAANACN